MPLETLTKLDAACRQLNTAIFLWFTDGDPVSTHTLACSAHQIVHDINQHQHGRDLVYDSLIYKDEHRKQVIKRLKEHYNFFKHADNDPSGVIEFDPVISDLFILIYVARPGDAGAAARRDSRSVQHILRALKAPLFE